jgi:glycosyltransferase involved in cell wall biosynthesis
VRRSLLIFIEDGSFTYDSRVIRESRTLAANGWDVTVICPKYAEDPFYKRIDARLRVYYFPKPNYASALGHLVEHGISLVLGSLLTLWVFLRHGFAVFHSCNPMDILWLIALPYKIFGVKIIFDQHDLCPELFLSRPDGESRSLYYRVLLSLEKMSYACADVVISTNETYKQTAIARGGKDAEDVLVVRNGPDLAKFRRPVEERGPRRGSGAVVGYVGNMNLQDGVEYLLQAAYEIVKERGRTDVSFVVIGGGSQQPQLALESIEMGLGDNVVFTGRISEEEMLSKLRACDLCVQPDPLNPLNDKSTMNKAMEYMALGKPVVSFDLRETRASCGDAALYAEPNSVKDLTDRILQLADNHQLCLKMGKKGRERVERRLCWACSEPQLIAAYQRATASRDH